MPTNLDMLCWYQPGTCLVRETINNSYALCRCTSYHIAFFERHKDRNGWMKNSKMLVYAGNICQSDDEPAETFRYELCHADILVLVAVTNEESIKWIQTNSANVPNII